MRDGGAGGAAWPDSTQTRDGRSGLDAAARPLAPRRWVSSAGVVRHQAGSDPTVRA